MTAEDLQALAAVAREETLQYRGLTEQARLTGLTHSQAFGIPACNPILIGKLQRMDPALYKIITTKDTK